MPPQKTAEEHPALMSTWDRVQQMHQRPLPALIPKYEGMRKALAECRRVDEAKDIGDKAEALRAYARQRHDIELERWVNEIKLRAVRRIGEISSGLDKSKGGRGKTVAAAGKPLKKAALAEAGISLSAASRYEKLAAIPIQEFDGYLDCQRAEGKVPTLTEMLISVSKRQKPDRRAAGTGPWCNEINLADVSALRPGPLLRVFKMARKQLRSESQKFHLILALLTELTDTTLVRATQIDRWHWKLLARLLDIDAIEHVRDKLAQLPGREQEAYLQRLMTGEDELFLAVDFGDDLEPVWRHGSGHGRPPACCSRGSSIKKPSSGKEESNRGKTSQSNADSPAATK